MEEDSYPYDWDFASGSEEHKGVGGGAGDNSYSSAGVDPSTLWDPTKGIDWGKLKSFITSPQGIAGLGGAALGFADRAKPSGGGTTMAYPGAAQLTRKMVQGPYGPLAEYTGVGGGVPDYTKFVAPTVSFAPQSSVESQPSSTSMASTPSKVEMYNQLKSYGMPEERIRRIQESMFGTQTDADWAELTKTIAPSAKGISSGYSYPKYSTTEPAVSKVAQPSYSAPAVEQTRETRTSPTGAATGIASVVPEFYRSYNMGQEALDYLNKQNIETKRPWEWDQATKTFTRQGANGAPEKMTYDEAMRKTNEDIVQKALGTSATYTASRDPAVQQKVDSYVKQALPLMLKEANERGEYRNITKLLVDTNFTQEDIDRVFGQGGLGKDFENRVKSGEIQTPIIYGDRAVAYNRSMRSHGDSNKILKEFEVPEHITKAYDLLKQSPTKPTSTITEPPSWFKYYSSPYVYPQTKDIAKDTAIEFANVYGREITPTELDDFMSGSRANIVQKLGLDPKKRENFVEAIAPARNETIERFLRDYQQGVNRQLNDFELSNIGLGQFNSPLYSWSLNIEDALKAITSNNPTKYVQQLNREKGAERPLIQDTKEEGKVAGIKLTSNKETGFKEFGGVSLIQPGSLPFLVTRYGLNKNELEQLEQLLVKANDKENATKVKQLRTGTLPPEEWAHADAQTKNTTEFFGVAGTPEADKHYYRSAYRYPIAQAAGLAQIGYQPGVGLPTSNFAHGGIAQIASHEGKVQMEDGGFVMTKRAVDGAGGPRGIQQLVPGARMIRGPGTGTSDDIPAVINGRSGQTPALLSNGEAYVPRGAVQDQGGPQRMYALMNNLQRKA